MVGHIVEGGSSDVGVSLLSADSSAALSCSRDGTLPVLANTGGTDSGDDCLQNLFFLWKYPLTSTFPVPAPKLVGFY